MRPDLPVLLMSGYLDDPRVTQSGLDLARRLRAVRPDLPVVLMRDDLDDPRVTEPGPEPDVRVLRKPFRGEELRAQVADALRTRPTT